MNKNIRDILQESSRVLNLMTGDCSLSIEKAVGMITDCLNKKGKILICGNGGSAADAQHFAAEIVGRFYMNRRPLPAIALTTDTSILTAVANDFGFKEVFARQVTALTNPEDVVIGISTSGNSENIVKALIAAREAKAQIISMTGLNDGETDKYAHCSIKIPSTDTPRIQEGHITAIHIICELVERITCT
jgi:D-sedoheptulose 7-phosphate isomerase